MTVRQEKNLRRLIEQLPEEAWTPIPYWLDGAADVAETPYVPFRHRRGALPARLIVRRVRPTPGSQLALLADYSYHAFVSDRKATCFIWSRTTAAMPKSSTPSVISNTESASTICLRGALPPTAPGWRCR